MSMMTYITPGIRKIDFQDSLFVLTEVGRDNTKDVQNLIEKRGGIVKGSVTKSTNYLIYGDREEETAKYKKVLELINNEGLKINVLPLRLFRVVSRGLGLIEFGKYPFDADGSQRAIQWTVLKQDKKRALLLSAYGLEAKKYNENLEDVTWSTCTLRKWLNEDFYKVAFTEEEKRRIQLTKVLNKDNQKYKTFGGDDTEDKLFLLSRSEAKRYLSTNFERLGVPSPYASIQGGYP